MSIRVVTLAVLLLLAITPAVVTGQAPDTAPQNSIGLACKWQRGHC